MTEDGYKKLVAALTAGEIPADQIKAAREKLKAFDQSKDDAEAHRHAAEKAAEEAKPSTGNPLTRADRDRMADKLARGGYPDEKVEIVKAKIAEFDAANK